MMRLKTLFRASLFSIPLMLVGTFNAYALSYKYCNDPNEFPACFIALEKLKTIDNPLTGKKYFDDGIHYYNGELFAYPRIDIAQTDLDNDGFNEIIVKVPDVDDLMQGAFCKENNQCPHFILQDRNIDGKPDLRKVRAMGPIFTFAIGLSTNEVVSGYRSLRAYTDSEIKDFNVYQYDKKSDDYFNITVPK